VISEHGGVTVSANIIKMKNKCSVLDLNANFINDMCGITVNCRIIAVVQERKLCGKYLKLLQIYIETLLM